MGGNDVLELWDKCALEPTEEIFGIVVRVLQIHKGCFGSKIVVGRFEGTLTNLVCILKFKEFALSLFYIGLCCSLFAKETAEDHSMPLDIVGLNTSRGLDVDPKFAARGGIVEHHR